IASRVTTSHLLVLNAGVTLAPEMLTWFAAAITRTGATVIYSDEDQVSWDAEERELLLPIFRPAFDQELLLQRNYIGETFCVMRQAFVELGGFVCDPSIDPRHDFLLRATTRYGRGAVSHLPLVLVHSHSSPLGATDKAARERL